MLCSTTYLASGKPFGTMRVALRHSISHCSLGSLHCLGHCLLQVVRLGIEGDFRQYHRFVERPLVFKTASISFFRPARPVSKIGTSFPETTNSPITPATTYRFIVTNPVPNHTHPHISFRYLDALDWSECI